MEVGEDLRVRVESWHSLSRWERSELGRGLRRAGLSYGEIMGLIPVKKSTLATWRRGVGLTAEQIEAIKARTGSVAGLPRDTNRKRRAEIKRIREEAREQAELLVAEPLWIAGTVLYWGEGFKTQNQLGMANSDPHALRLFMKWCAQYHLPDTGYRAKLNIHFDNDESAARAWWADQLSLTLDDFNKSFVKPEGTGHRKNHLPNGVCLVIKRKSADVFHRTLAWVEFLQHRMGR